jgi:putative peptidoglycan lipid II flippase
MLMAAAALGLSGRWLLPLAGSSFSPEKLHLATALFFGLLLWLPMSACIATWKAVLNASGLFALAAIAPLASPLATIALLYAFAPSYGVTVLCVGAVAGVAIECLLLAFAVRRIGFPIHPAVSHWKSPELVSLRRQYLPLAASAVISSACVVADQSIAGRLGPGEVSALAYGTKVVAVLLAAVASAAGTAVLPVFSRLVAARDWKRLRHSLLVYAGTVTLIMTPLTALLIAGSGPLVRLLFEHGAFEATAAQVVTNVQRFALLQAPFAILWMIATRLTTALAANRLLVWTGAAALITDIVLDILFSRWMGVAGIALASSAVSVVSLAVLVLLLRAHEPRAFAGGAG